MPDQPIISAQGLTKSYRIWKDPAARLLGPVLAEAAGWVPGAVGASLQRHAHESYRDFYALRNVSFEVHRGEAIGIVGRNGAGKSTLLQLIAGTLQPSSGSIGVRGRVAALLELGSGFNPDFSGRENIHLNAAILGLTPAEIKRKFDSIVEYSGVAEFIDQPVRTYSSGMVVRLAFAVCVHVDAEILIIDEALAVGDARFQFKCHATLDRMIQEGRTVIFVSHDTNAVKRMCRSALLLERGEVLLKGTPNDVTNIYTKLITSPHGLEAIRGDLEALRQTSPNSPEPATGTPATLPVAVPDRIAATSENERLLTEERSHRQISDKEYSYGGELGRIESVTVTDPRDQPRLSFVVGEVLRVRAVCRAAAEIRDPIYALTLKDVRGQEIYGTNTYFQNQSPPTLAPGSCSEACFELTLNVLPGVYFLSLGWVRLVDGEVIVVHRRYDVIRFDVLPRDKSFGLAYCPTTIAVRQLPV